jgi:HupE / UreJ protein
VSRALLVVICALLVPSAVLAHRASDSFLALAQRSGRSLHGHWDVALGDLDYALGLDDGDGALTWGELRAREGDLARMVRSGLSFQSERGACPLSAFDLQMIALSDGPYARIAFDVRCPDGAESARLSTLLLADVDRDHRILLRVGNGDEAATYALGRSTRTRTLPLSTAAFTGAGVWSAFRAQIGRGLLHIFEGTDHIAFLLVLLLPALFRRKPETTIAARRGALLLAIVKVVSAFTLAHSLTLSLAALGLLRTSADVIEPAIAASVALAALSNLWPRLVQEGALLAFALGLLHGFGFSSALADAGLSGPALLAALLGFNLGVECGQLLIVALFVPLALALTRLRLCREYALSWGSAAVLALSLFWVFERLQTG